MRKFLDVFGQTAFEAHTERFNDPTNWNAASRSEVVNECGGGGLSVMHYCTDDVHRMWGKQHQFVAGLCSHGKMGKWRKKKRLHCIHKKMRSEGVISHAEGVRSLNVRRKAFKNNGIRFSRPLKMEVPKIHSRR